MAVINQIFDNQLTQSDIVVPLMSPPDEDGGNNSNTNQVTIHGVCIPVVSICGIVFEFDRISKMILYDNDRIPSLDLTIIDNDGLLSSISNPKDDNEIRLQILPPFEEAYKKINLTFYINDIDIKGTKVNINAIYKIPELYISRLQSFGEINTYDLFKEISSQCKLGFASNCEANDKDKRFIYCNNISYEDLMSREIKMAAEQTNVFDYWIDLWNNINYVNIYQRFHDKDKQEDLEAWTLNTPAIDIDSDVELKPIKQETIITNNPDMMGQLHTKKYILSNNIGKNKIKGTDRVYTVYKDGAIIDSLIEDGNVNNDIFTKYYYLGENIGEYEYLTAISFYDSFNDLINKNSIEVILEFPNLGITRGSHVKFLWYDNNYVQKEYIKSLGGDMQSDLPDQENELVEPDKLMINKQISGEYLVYKTILKYNKGKWSNSLLLTRPADQIKTYMP